MPEPQFIATVRGLGLGWIVALLVLFICIMLAILGVALTPALVLGLIGALALSRLL